jgi:hypothetical protein
VEQTITITLRRKSEAGKASAFDLSNDARIFERDIPRITWLRSLPVRRPR